jgi:two-component system chemotaxis response regulator CheB
MQMTKIRVLVVDDSLLFRKVMTTELEKDDQIEVIASAGDAYEARDMIVKHRPDVVTLDLNMPKMNGTEFLRKLMAQYPLPIVVVSGESGRKDEVLAAGATAFAVKPDAQTKSSVTDFIQGLIQTVKDASKASFERPVRAAKKEEINFDYKKIIAIGASTGGVDAVHQVITALPANMPPILIAQHIPPKFSQMFAQRLDAESKLSVKEAVDGDEVKNGHVLIAPGDKHMRIRRVGGRLIVKVTDDAKVNGHRPSVDILFDSFADVIKKNSVGVILTGMGKDGAKGLLRMKDEGSVTIGQDEATSVVYGMPMEAYNIGAVQTQLPLKKIAGQIVNSVKKNG